MTDVRTEYALSMRYNRMCKRYPYNFVRYVCGEMPANFRWRYLRGHYLYYPTRYRALMSAVRHYINAAKECPPGFARTVNLVRAKNTLIDAKILRARYD